MKRLPCSYPKKPHLALMPEEMPRHLSVQIWDGAAWVEVQRWENNHRRLLIQNLEVRTQALRVLFRQSWGGERSGVFACEVGAPDYSIPPQAMPWPEPHWTGERRAGA
ncbi:MAG: hypothetical protein HC904_17405 [Blastochloris sp.]|nr:hypothetical protein [Blastochloris sp.]